MPVHESCGPLPYLGAIISPLWQHWPMDMTANFLGSNPADNRFSLSGTCPHCRYKVMFAMVSAPHLPAESQDLTFQFTASPIDSQAAYEVWALLACQSCRNFICGSVIKSKTDRKQTIYNKHYPIGTPDDSVPEEIPEQIGEDFQEALRCHSLKCYKAVVTMCRRSLQAACIDLEAGKREKLPGQIDALAKEGKITEPLREQAHDIRLGGNDGAHPDQDGLENVTSDDADDMIDFTRDFFYHVYVMPKRREARKAERQAKKAAKQSPTESIP